MLYPSYIHDSVCRWRIVKKIKYFEVISNTHEFSRVCEVAQSRLVYANKFPWIAQSYFLNEWGLHDLRWPEWNSVPFYRDPASSRILGFQIPELCINYILWLHVKSFILARWKPSFLLPGSRFVWTKLSRVITSARLGGMKMLVTHQFERTQRSTFQ